MSEDIREFIKAFSCAKENIKKPNKSGYNGHTKQNYSTVDDIYQAILKPLKSNNIEVWHYRTMDGGIEYLHTRLHHTPSSQFIEDLCVIESDKPGNQGRGSAITYQKRYALLNLCAIAPDEEDDGQSEQEEFITDTQLKILENLLDSCSNAQELAGHITSHYKIKNLSYLKSEVYAAVKSWIEKKKE